MFNENIDELNNCVHDMQFFSLDNETHLAKVIKCYDGDTFYCIFKHDNKYQKFKVRMLHYNSPEIRPSRKKSTNDRKMEKINAIKAKKKLEQLILNKIIVLYCKKFDNFGRILAEVKLDVKDKETVNDIMLNEGYGVPYVK